MSQLSTKQREAILYYATVDVPGAPKRKPPTSQVVRELVGLGHAVTLSSPYPFAPSHAHLTKTGRDIAACGTHCLNGLQCLKDFGSCICLCDGCKRRSSRWPLK